MDLTTILKAAQILGDTTPAAISLYEGFVALTTGADQSTLKARLAVARVLSDQLHERVQSA